MTDTFPTEQINYWIASNPGSYSTRHIDANGFGTVATMLTGLKIWYIFLPNDAYPKNFCDETINPIIIPIGRWKIYLVVLQAGDTMWVMVHRWKFHFADEYQCFAAWNSARRSDHRTIYHGWRSFYVAAHSA